MDHIILTTVFTILVMGSTGIFIHLANTYKIVSIILLGILIAVFISLVYYLIYMVLGDWVFN